LQGTYSLPRIDDNRLLKKLNYKPEGRRNIGRPLTRWEGDSGRKEQAKGPKPYS
jgi:hypothetical protein